jgi:hypothetical protein
VGCLLDRVSRFEKRSISRPLPPAARASAQLPDEVLEAGIRHVGVAPRRDIGPTRTSGLPQCLELGLLEPLALFHQAQALTQSFAGVLVATGLHQALDHLVLSLAQDHIARRHGNHLDG